MYNTVSRRPVRRSVHCEGVYRQPLNWPIRGISLRMEQLSIRSVHRNLFDRGSIDSLRDSAVFMIGDRVVRLFCANASDSTPLVRLFKPHVDPKDRGVYVQISTSLPEHAYSVRGRGAAPEHYTCCR